MKKRILAVLLCLCMVLTMLPVSALAAVGGLLNDTPEQNETLLEKLQSFTGESPEEALELLDSMGLLDEDGNLITDQTIDLDGKQHTLEEMEALLLELQQVIDDLLAFWGCADDYVDQEDCRNILKCGKYVERLDLYIRLDYHKDELEKEYKKLVNRLRRANLCYNEDNLKRLEELIHQGLQQITDKQEALGCLGGLLT